MAQDPTDKDFAAYAAAARTPVVFAEGQLGAKGAAMSATRLYLCTVVVGGVPRIVLEDNMNQAIVEITGARVAAARMESRAFDPTAVVEVRGRSDSGQLAGEDGEPQYFVVGGPKRVLRHAFGSIGVAL